MPGMRELTILSAYHFGSDFRHNTGDRFSGSSIVGHFKFHRVADFQVLDIATELAEMEK